MVDADGWQHESTNNNKLTELKVTGAVHLFDKPLIEYLNDDESPRFILAARSKAPKFSGSEPPTWSGDKLGGMAMHMVTDKRWLIIAGMKGGDEPFEIPFEDINSIEYSTGYLGHKVNISTNSFDIEIPIGNMHDEEILKLVTQYIKNPAEFDPESHSSIKIVSDSNSKSSIDELISNAEHNSVDKKHLTELKSGLTGRYLYDKPLIEYLNEGEQPHYLLEGLLPVNFSGSNPPRKDDGKSSGRVLNLLTDERWIITEAQKTGDQMWVIDYDEIDNIEIENEGGYAEGMFIETSEYTVELSQLVDQPTEAAVNYIKRAHFDEKEPENDFEPVTIIDRTSGFDDTLYAKLIVPTKSSGATFSSRGWNVGGDIIRGTSSKGEIKDNNWENYVNIFIINQDHVEIGVTHGDLSLTSDNQVHQTIRLDLNDISDVRVQMVEAGTGFIFETAEDVYQFKLTRQGKLSTANRGDAQDAVRALKRAIREAPNKKEEDSSTAQGKEPDREDSPTEKLSQIKELHDQGVLTDEEFEDKKQELLDQI